LQHKLQVLLKIYNSLATSMESMTFMFFILLSLHFPVTLRNMQVKTYYKYYKKSSL
jgi:hypothetical protein